MIDAIHHHLQKGIYFILLLSAPVVISGCRSPATHRLAADRVAETIIQEKRKESSLPPEPVNIDRPSDILRRKLLTDQHLPYIGPVSLGSDQLLPIDNWPETGHPEIPGVSRPVPAQLPLRLSLTDALQVAARNSSEYQDKKESIFEAALDLDLERNSFRNTFIGQVSSLLSTDQSSGETVSGIESSGSAGWQRKLAQGAELSTAIAVDLANLLTLGKASSLGITADASISIPLLRGAGRHIVTEPLIQAERNVVYAIYTFERFKRTFAVSVAREYFSALQQMDEVKNAEENYRSLISSARRSRRLAEAGRLPAIQVDQAFQNELRARNRVISSTQQFQSRLDQLKSAIGLPPDARIEIDRTDLAHLRAPAQKIINRFLRRQAETTIGKTPPADAPIHIIRPSNTDAGPLELEPPVAIQLALTHRLDLLSAMGAVYDAQRQVVVAADNLGAELTFLGSANIGETRSIASATQDDATLRFDRGRYEALLTLDLPFERTAERNEFRKDLIALENAVRNIQSIEDDIKLSILSTLRTLAVSRESLKIQAQAVKVAEKRVKSINLFLEAGRAQIRDLLEAQEALFSAQNDLTAAVIDYRLGELALQRDMGVLAVSPQGLWQEYTPGAPYDSR